MENIILTTQTPQKQQNNALLFPIPILILPPIPVLPVFPILPVPIIIPVLPLIHINSIDKYTEIGNILIVTDVVDESKLALSGIISPTDVYTKIGSAGYELGVSDHTDRGSVEYDVIEMLAKDTNGCLQRRTGHQFGRIGGQNATGQDIQVGRHCAGTAK